MDIREKVFNNRSYTPIPLLVAIVVFAEPTIVSIAAGVGLMLVGELLRVWSVRYAGGATRTTSGVGGDVLVTAGPYAHLRNPLYLGNFFNALGICIAAWAWMPWMVAVLVILFSVQYGLIVSLEEEYLRGRFRESYAEYARNVPRFLPRLRGWYLGQQVVPDSVKRALRTERSTLGALALFLLLILLRWRVF